MVNAQEWLQEKFPTEEIQKAVKILYITGEKSGWPMTLRQEEAEANVQEIVLEGEINLNNFVNLEKLVIKGYVGNIYSQKITNVKAEKLTKITHLQLGNCPILTSVELSNCAKLNQIVIIECPNLGNFSLQDTWKQQNQQLNQINNLISPNQPYNFAQFHQELKRLKIQDLTIQIPLKKQELEQLTNNAKSKLTRAEQYPLEKLLKKHSKTLQGNNNREKINELKEILSEKLTGEEIQALLTKQQEVFNLEKHLESLQGEQVAQIVQVRPFRNNS